MLPSVPSNVCSVVRVCAGSAIGPVASARKAYAIRFIDVLLFCMSFPFGPANAPNIHLMEGFRSTSGLDRVLSFIGLSTMRLGQPPLNLFRNGRANLSPHLR